ncbi:MAG TPA: sirohydrochlorin chelatase [Stenomitos sp.]
MSESRGYFLIAHGSRDLRSLQGLEACADLVCDRLSRESSLTPALPWVGSGTLEFGEQPLSDQIEAFAKAVVPHGIRQIALIPAFLSAGRHVSEDIPDEVRVAQQNLTASLNVELTLCPYLGSHPEIGLLLQDKMKEMPCDRWILLAHGTRYLGSNHLLQTLASQVNAAPAFWTMPPSLEAQLEAFPHDQSLRVGIVPYFLFEGRIIDAIHAAVDSLRSKFVNLDLHLLPPLNPSTHLAQLLLDCALPLHRP